MARTSSKRMRMLKSILAGGACALALAGAAMAQTRDFDVPAGDLKAALDAYARQAGIEVIYRTDDVRGAKSHGAHGALSPKAALAEILAGTGLEVREGQNGALAVVRAAQKSADTQPSTVSEVVVT